jgi:transposase
VRLLGIAISASTIGRWLRAEKIRPWRYHSWQHIHDPQQFLPRARPVLQLYACAQALLGEGTWLLSLDEKTSIQARQGEQEPRPALAGKPQLHASRYHRRGARHLFAGLSVAEGHVYGTCRTRKCFVDFQAFVQQVMLPEALRRKVTTVALILDNGTTHAPKQLEGWLQQLEATLQPPLPFQVSWLPPNASWLDQIEIWFSILQRKRLQPNHFRSQEDLEHSILDFLASYNQTAKPINWTYTVEKLERKLGTHL